MAFRESSADPEMILKLRNLYLGAGLSDLHLEGDRFIGGGLGRLRSLSGARDEYVALSGNVRDCDSKRKFSRKHYRALRYDTLLWVPTVCVRMRNPPIKTNGGS